MTGTMRRNGNVILLAAAPGRLRADLRAAVLRAVTSRPGGVRVRAIAALLGASPAVVRRVARELEDEDLLVRMGMVLCPNQVTCGPLAAVESVPLRWRKAAGAGDGEDDGGPKAA